MPERILVLSYAFPPMAVPEAYLVAKSMGNLPSFQCDVVCGSGKLYSTDREDHSLDGYVGSRFGTVTKVQLPSYAKLLFRSRLPLLSQMPDPWTYANRRLLKIVERLDLHSYTCVVTWSQWHSVHLAGLEVKKRYPFIPWIAHFSDPWVDNPYVQYGKMARRWNSAMERSVIEAADLLLFTSQETVDLVMKKYSHGLMDKTMVVPHPYDTALYARQHRESGPVTIRHLGHFYGIRTPEPLFRAMAELWTRVPQLLDGVLIELVGHVPETCLSSPSYRALPKGLMRIRGAVDYVASMRLMAEADGLVLIDAAAETSVFLPSKLIDYVGAGKPVFGITPKGASAGLIRHLGGWLADPSDTASIAKTMVDYLSFIRQNAACEGLPWGREDIRLRYEVASVARLFEAAVRRVLN